ncbi:MAG TPA: mannose-1-phosphate guanylyltransferase/mannose-6-phosphate isomerase [Thermohalobaculum sp.]|nr:mannose-1-phosphate guanylyltransferase/mannose-6-phosphate isomerase [Thermohalobaculum sp.]
MQDPESVFPVVLCGGSGTRLWPVSRRSRPKQFTALLGGETLLQRTVGRVRGRGFADPLMMTHSDFRFVVAEQLAEAGVNPGRIVIEPAVRNTAPAVAMAARLAAAANPDAVLLVLPSDHVIADEDAFLRALFPAVEAARGGAFVTFGIRPDRPETGYGYIELGGPPGEGAQPFVRFVEKPDLAAAEEMAASGRFLWNSGMFAFPAGPLLAAFEEHAPEVARATAEALAGARDDLDFLRPGAEAYAASPDISIDYAIMERAGGGVVVPVDCGWNDLGSWKTVWQEAGGGAATRGQAVAIDCEDVLLRSDDPGVAMVGIGLRNLAAVATGDAVLVADLDRAQDVRLAVEALAARGAPQAHDFPRCHRPWGWYETLAQAERFQVKRIVVKPGGLLSLQSHVHRAEHWVVVSGTARVTVGDEERLLTENQSTYIPLGAVHRLENPGRVALHLIEVQSGAYLGEDDIVRYEDVYARG